MQMIVSGMWKQKKTDMEIDVNNEDYYESIYICNLSECIKITVDSSECFKEKIVSYFNIL